MTPKPHKVRTRLMPRWASRITLELTGVRVERVQEISKDDVEAEGFRDTFEHSDDCDNDNCALAGGPGDCDGVSVTSHAYFRHYWNSTYAKRGFGWDQNPFVWVGEFRRI